MQVICPNCGARYAVDPLAIGPVGRIVQCARCSHRWLQTVAAAKANEPKEAPKGTVEAAETADAAPGSSFSARPADPEPEPQIGGNPAAPNFTLGPARTAEPVEPIEPIPDLVIRPPRQRTSLPAVIEARPHLRPPVKIVIALMVLVVVIAAAVGVYLFRDDILPMIPEGWRTMLHLTP
jgi:predicted Zn finger-like uncharacterized protein